MPSLEKVVPAGHRHVPAWHVEPPRQTAPQAPHEELDVARLVQLPEQHATSVSEPQAAPHVPQLFLSTAVLVQSPPTPTQ